MRCGFLWHPSNLGHASGIICPGHSGTVSRPVLGASARSTALAQIAFGGAAVEQASDLHALVRNMRKDPGNKFFQSRNDRIVDRGHGAGGNRKDLMVYLAIFDLLQQANWIAFQGCSCAERLRGQHEAIDRVAIAADGADDKAVRVGIAGRHIDRVQMPQRALVVDIFAPRTGLVFDEDLHGFPACLYTNLASPPIQSCSVGRQGTAWRGIIVGHPSLNACARRSVPGDRSMMPCAAPESRPRWPHAAALTWSRPTVLLISACRACVRWPVTCRSAMPTRSLASWGSGHW